MDRYSPAAEHETAALAYLRAELGADAPAAITAEAAFAGEPLVGEGPISVFRFRTSIGGEPPDDYWVVAGKTVPNYYPSWGLEPGEVYALHLGTRFMMTVGTATVPMDRLPADLASKVHAFVETVAPGEPVSEITPAAAWRVEDEVHAICRVRIAGEAVYVLGLDCPPGIYRKIELPPHVVYRLHVGTLIQREYDAEVRAGRKICDTPHTRD